MALYRILLADQWHALAPAIQRLHADDAPLNAAGRFQISHGAGRLARRLVRLAGMPAAGENIRTGLTVTPTGDDEIWLRSFGGSIVQTFQRQAAPGVLAERFGRLELRFRLEVLDGGICYRQVGAAFCLGPIRLALPQWLVPQVNAWERPGDRHGCASVSVVVSAPLAGLLISYEGEIEPEARVSPQEPTA